MFGSRRKYCPKNEDFCKKKFQKWSKKNLLKKVVSFEKLVIKSGLGFLIQSKLSKPLLLEAVDSKLGFPFNPILTLWNMAHTVTRSQLHTATK